MRRSASYDTTRVIPAPEAPAMKTQESGNSGNGQSLMSDPLRK
jgi:hypothetical protein